MKNIDFIRTKTLETGGDCCDFSSNMEAGINTMEDIIKKYKGNYMEEMRKIVGHAPLMGIGCGVIIENEKGEILLQKRRDNGCWAILGGAMEAGEKITETVKREVQEEAGIEVKDLELFAIYLHFFVIFNSSGTTFRSISYCTCIYACRLNYCYC